MVRIIIAGGRDFNDSKLFEEKTTEILAQYEDIELVSGHARGADAMAEKYANDMGIRVKVMPAEWNKYGKAAGPIRNKQMLDYALEEVAVLIAFWDGSSKGTKDMINRAREYGAKCHIVMYK